MAQNVIDEDNETCQHMHFILRLLEIRTFLYFHLEILKHAFLAEVAHFFSSKILRWLKIRREFIRFLNYENHKDSWKIDRFFDGVISGQDDVTTVRF